MRLSPVNAIRIFGAMVEKSDNLRGAMSFSSPGRRPPGHMDGGLCAENAAGVLPEDCSGEAGVIQDKSQPRRSWEPASEPVKKWYITRRDLALRGDRACHDSAGMSDELFDDVDRQAAGGRIGRRGAPGDGQSDAGGVDADGSGVVAAAGACGAVGLALRRGPGSLGDSRRRFGRARGGRVGRRLTRRFWWRCGCTRRSMAWAARAKWIGCATRMTRIGGCAAACR